MEERVAPERDLNEIIRDLMHHEGQASQLRGELRKRLKENSPSMDVGRELARVILEEFNRESDIRRLFPLQEI